MKVRITANAGAGQRTMNRLREHGPIFYVVREASPSCLRGQRGLYVESEQTFWRGWLPDDEVECDANPGDWPPGWIDRG